MRTGAAPVRARVPPTEPRLVTWASEADEVVVDRQRLEATADRPARTDFDDFVVVPGVEPGRSGSAPVARSAALAVYELDPDELPGRDTGGGIDLPGAGRRRAADRRRDRRAGRRRGGPGGHGPGERTVRGSPSSARACPRRPAVGEHVDFGGDGATASGGCDDADFDPADGSASWLEDRHLPEPGDTARIRMWVSRGFRDAPRWTSTRARLALAAYDQARAGRRWLPGGSCRSSTSTRATCGGTVGTRVAARGQGEAGVRN